MSRKNPNLLILSRDGISGMQHLIAELTDGGVIVLQCCEVDRRGSERRVSFISGRADAVQLANWLNARLRAPAAAPDDRAP